MAKFSVIIPNYNHAEFLNQRIESVLNQTHKDFEIIILDDCSNDNSRIIIETYRTHPQIQHIVYNQENSGNTFHQWAKGIALATSEYIWIAESDDYIENSFLEEADRCFEENKKVGLFRCGTSLVNERGETLYVIEKEGESKIIEGKSFLFNEMTITNSLCNASAIVFAKKYVELPLKMDILSMRYCGDWLFWSKILLQSDIFLFNKNLNYFRRHYNSVSQKANAIGLTHTEGIKVYDFITKHLTKNSTLSFINKDRDWAKSLLKMPYNYKLIIKVLYSTMKIKPYIIPFFIFYKLKKSCFNK